VFICDTMLGKLARWLRILGYDTLYTREEDNDILAIARRENRMILTRDRELAERAERGFLLRGFSIDEQLMELLKAGIITIDESRMLTRCTLCNSILRQVDKDQVEGKVPEGSFESSDRFWYCGHCDKYYWTGKHWADIRERVERLRRLRTSP